MMKKHERLNKLLQKTLRSAEKEKCVFTSFIIFTSDIGIGI